MSRRPRNPLMLKIDDAINYLEARKMPITVAAVTTNAIKRIPAVMLLAEIDALIKPLSRRRLIGRGFKVSDEVTFDRTHWREMTQDDYHDQIAVKQVNRDAIDRHLRAEKAVEKLLAAKSASFGRAVSAGEVEKDVRRVYERFGIALDD